MEPGQAQEPVAGAIAGLRVIDLSRVLAGPLATQILADHGAEVIKIEPPRGDETRDFGPPFDGGSAAYFGAVNRNKLSLSLDLSLPAGRELLLQLLADADVMVENFVPGTLERWGLGPEELLRRFPRLVVCRISGFGADGPLGGLPGYDAVVQALAGLMSVNGDPDGGATRLGVPAVDLATGLNAAIGILLALAERGRSGRGQCVEVCLFDCALSLLVPHAANWFASGTEPRRMGSAHPNIAPYDKFAARDGEVFLGVSNDRQFARLCELLGAPQLASDPRFASNRDRVAHRDELRGELERRLAAREASALCDELMRAGVPAGAVLSVGAALSHPHARHRGMAATVGGTRCVGIPLKLSRTPGSLRTAPPAFAADTGRVLERAGLSPERVAQLLASGAVVAERRREAAA